MICILFPKINKLVQKKRVKYLIDLASAAISNVAADEYDLFIYFNFFYCVGSIAANPTIAAIQ
jgi:hypothetical protein